MAEISVGEKAPTFELPDQTGYPWNLSGQLELGPAMLVFYRGDWCPYCNGQLASLARGFERFARYNTEVAAISVDPPEHSLALSNKLLLPFPVLTDPKGELAKRYGLWDAKEGVAVPATVLIDRTGEVAYLYAGKDFADRPAEEEVLSVLKRLKNTHKHGLEGPEVQVNAVDSHDSVRPDRPAMTLDQLIPYYQGVFFSTVALGGRFSGWGRSGRHASGEVSNYRTTTSRYAEALRETIRLHES
ncbi:MAG TPA: peroxiredoxin family protein [Rubrobacteraceae bacterium]|nr:peroxiredoxin family protein [Rubrobacteraceae bacterium]